MGYDPRSHWTRLHDRNDLSAVGQSGLSADLNHWLYRALEGRVRRYLRDRRVLDGVTRAFDVGAGTGYWVRVWHDMGVPTVDGCDLVEAAAAALDARFGERGDRFVASDIGAPDAGLPEGPYGFVSVMNVLLHLVDDEPFERALANVAALVGPGGHLLLVEPILFDASFERPRTPEQASRARSLARYRDPLLAAGLELVDVRGAVALANNPIEAGSRAAYRRYARSWRWVTRWAKRSRRATRLLGPALVAADRLAVGTGAAPSSKLALFRRPPGT
jgi:SAM-dependent methyltransferase